MKQAISANFLKKSDWFDNEPFVVNSFLIDKNSKTIHIPECEDSQCTKINNQHINVTSVSLFTQARIHSCDINPIIYSLKEKDGWKFEVTDSEISQYVEKILSKYKFLNKKFDTLINLDYMSNLTMKFKQELEAQLSFNDVVYDDFVNVSFDYEDLNSLLISWERRLKEFGETHDAIKAENYMCDYLYKQKTKRNFFLGKEFPEQYLKYLSCADGITKNGKDYVSTLCNKDIIIIDNESYSNEKLSESVSAINRIFFPKSITVIKLF